jgi:hypothetical protein
MDAQTYYTSLGAACHGISYASYHVVLRGNFAGMTDGDLQPGWSCGPCANLAPGITETDSSATAFQCYIKG